MKDTARKLRICALGDARGVHVQMRSRGLARLGHDVAILSDVPADLPDLEVLAPTHGNRTAVARGLAYLEMVSLLRRWRPDVLVLHFASRPFNWLLPLVWFKPFAASVMGGDILFHQRHELSPARQRATLRLLALSDLIISPTAYMLEPHPGLQSKALVSTWGIDVGRFAHPVPPAGRAPLTRGGLGIAASARVVFSPRRLVPACNVLSIVEAMPLVRERVGDAVLLLVNYGPDADYRQLVAEAIDRLGARATVVWADPADYDRMPELYQLSDVTVSVARSDGVSQSVLESMAAGTPVVLGDLPNYRGLFENGRHCRLVDPRDAASIAAGIVDVLTDADLRARITDGGRSTVFRDDNISVQVQKVEQAIQGIVAGPRRPWRLLQRLWHGIELMRLPFERDDAR